MKLGDCLLLITFGITIGMSATIIGLGESGLIHKFSIQYVPVKTDCVAAMPAIKPLWYKTLARAVR